jgi:hypothetical protein
MLPLVVRDVVRQTLVDLVESARERLRVIWKGLQFRFEGSAGRRRAGSAEVLLREVACPGQEVREESIFSMMWK